MSARAWMARPLTADDSDGVLQLSSKVFGVEAANREWWNWKYMENPAGPAIGFVAEVGTEIVGHYTVFPKRFHTDGREVMVALSGDTMVRSDFRRQGVFAELARRTYDSAARAGMDMVFGFPNRNSHEGFITTLAWHDVLPCAPLWLKPLSLARVAGRVPGLGTLLQPPLSGVERLLVKVRLPRRGRVVSPDILEVSVGAAQLPAVSGAVAQRRRFTAVRDADYLRWRYCARPDQKYRALAGMVDGEPVGYLVYGVRTEAGMQSGFLMELEIREDHIMDVGRCLVARLADILRCESMEVLSSLTMPGSLEARLLRESGFLLCPKRLMPRKLFLGYRLLGTRELVRDTCANSRSWSLSWGDHDVV